MNKLIKKIAQVAWLVLMLFAFKACVEPDNLTTSDAKTGGLVKALTANVPYKLNNTPKVDVNLLIPKGPGIASIEVHKVFYTVDGDASNEVVLKSIDLGSNNTSDDVSKTLSLTYADLIKDLTVGGNPLPADESNLNIGDYWVLNYISVMADGRNVINNASTNIGVANLYAGNYLCQGVFHHPTAGDRPILQDKYLTPIDAFSCYTDLGDLGSSGYDITIYVNEDNSVTVTAGPNHVTDVFMSPAEENSYNPATGVFVLHYFYVGATGNRVIDETYTPE